MHNHLTAAGLIIVFNPRSQSSNVRLCVDPSRNSKSANKSVNDTFKVGFPHIPNIAINLIKSQLYVTNCVGDISNFYANHHFNIEGSLLSAVFLQTPIDGSKYPNLDSDGQVMLELYLYTGSKFGYVDAGSLSCLAKSMLPLLYNKHYPNSIHKIPSKQLLGIKSDLVDSYIDDLHTGASLHDIESEFAEPTFCHKLVPDYR